MNIEELNKQKELLWDEVEKIETQRNELINSKLTQLFNSISNIFDKFEIKVLSDTNIYFCLKEDKWYNFNIYRSYDWQNKSYYNEYISCGSHSSSNDNVLMLQIAVGQLAKCFLVKDEIYKEILSLMDEYSLYEQHNIKQISSQIYNIDNQLNAIKKSEREKLFNEVFNKGTFKLKKRKSFYYGNGKRDYVSSDRFFWKANPSGKTYTVSYEVEYRQPGGKEFELTTFEVDKRIKKENLESFIDEYIGEIVES